MAPKKRKQASSNQGDTFVVLRDSKTSTLHLIPTNQLSYSKRENLKISTAATFNGAGDVSRGFKGIILAKGTRDQCQQSLSIIEKTNSKDGQISNEVKSDSSHTLHIDERTESSDSDDHENAENQPDIENKTGPDLPISEALATSVQKKSNTADMSSSTFVNTDTSSATTANLSSSSDAALIDLTNGAGMGSKRNEASMESKIVTNKKIKLSGTFTQAACEKLARENVQLKKELDMYKENWMPRPTGAAKNYIVDVGRVLSGELNNNEEDKGEKLENICTTLGLNEKELKSCEHKTDITKTCRQIVKKLYSEPKERAKLSVVKMDLQVLQAIHSYAKLAHPAMSNIQNCMLNNAIGNVFATDKRKYENDETNVSEEEETEDDDVTN
ncbi:unnamed protein product [Adineta ricciae]|uniref:BEN domain-containing protein n=1 Tax=Adineta ricciae TaxID=249248 RepID=A0A815G0G6_ADIRI|nr:unnamed protein product [Adineta ricciae]CAF1332327.1 unnamed protein product [Adineta ricciae]